MAYVLQPNSNFTVDSQKCNYFQFSNPSNSTSFTGSFTSTPQVAMYLLNLTEYSVAQASGSSIVDYTYVSGGDLTAANHFMMSADKFNVSIPSGGYYVGFCNWQAVQTQVFTNSTGIQISW